MIAGLVVVPFVSIATPKPEAKTVEQIFACYEETVTITKKRSLKPKDNMRNVKIYQLK